MDSLEETRKYERKIITNMFKNAKVLSIVRPGSRWNMAFYISIDGDDTGSKIAIGYLENNEEKLSQAIQALYHILSQLQEYLKKLEFEIIFCAADGIACKGEFLHVEEFSKYLKEVGTSTYTLSAGIGSDLQSSYFALKYAKAAGKNKTVICKDKEKFQII